jgi:hypothetical protein
MGSGPPDLPRALFLALDAVATPRGASLDALLDAALGMLRGAPPLAEACDPAVARFALLAELLLDEAGRGSFRDRVLRRVLDDAGVDRAPTLLDATGRRSRSLVGHPQVMARLQAERDALPPSALLEGAYRPMLARAEALGIAASLRWMGVVARLPEPDLCLALDRAARAGRAALVARFESDPRAAWEIQRSGLAGRPLLEGDLFAPLLALLHADEAGLDVEGPLGALVARRAGRPLTYYAGFDGLPRDADDAALLLVAAHTLGQGRLPDSLLAEAREVLAACLPPEATPRVWEEGAEDAFGPRCVGVAARALRALSLDGADLRRRAALRTWLEEQADPDGGFTAVHYPDRVKATALVVEALACPSPDPMGTALPRAISFLVDAQRVDGALGEGALASALAVLALQKAEALSPRLAREAGAFLVRSQRWDGLWPEEGLFLCPHPDGSMRCFGSRVLSTAVVLAAIERIRPLAQHAPAEPCPRPVVVASGSDNLDPIHPRPGRRERP